MCGITEFFGQSNNHQMSELATAMAERIAYRGPDDYGVCCNAEAGINLVQPNILEPIGS